MTNAPVNGNAEFLRLLDELEKPEIIESLTVLLTKLPDIKNSLDSVENVIGFGRAILTDDKPVDKYDRLVSTYNLNFETITSLVTLMGKLPKIIQVLEQIENIIDFGAAILQDKQTTEYAMKSVKGYIDPVIEKGQIGLSLFKDAQDRAENHPQPIRLISIMKWLKDPSVQKTLNYIQATLDLLREKK